MAQSSSTNTSAQRKVWLVTGCSSGLGKHIACAVLARGDKIIATARQLSDLDYIKDQPGGTGRAHCITLDVTASSERIQKEIDKAIEHFGRIDVLVNNAGYVLSGVLEQISDEELRNQMNTNFFGAISVTRCILPYMRKAHSGVILFMGSISGWYGVGAGSPYSASKFAIEGAAESLARETAHLNIRTHILVLGQFRTNILSSMRKAGPLCPTTGLADYDFIKTEMAVRHKETHGKQPGDPRAAAEKVVDIGRMENLSEAEQQGLDSLRIPLGTDSIQVMQTKCEQTLQHLKAWSKFAASTDYEGVEAVPSYLR
ncbi:hypothetical protein OPT61_g2339 [Boeremia exigua]|uniref:Uncharacterized protein n=1 Tax=Boeremia exigua TaxID=749465 RepID=A0ACC2IM97_9PLEO|nr:hypothetical protein OPT61_g2339 [Boeremia exigua]